MDLVEAFLLVARHLAPQVPESQLLEATRGELLGLLSGRPSGRIPPSVSTAITVWMQTVRRASGDPEGDLYQEMLGLQLGHTEEGQLLVVRDAGKHRATGAFYTGGHVVAYMMARARQYAPEAASIIDPACGHGAFLDQAQGVFGRSASLTGLDLDATAITLCQARVPRARLCVADALLEETPTGFDLCIGNPPYVSSGLRGAARFQEGQVQALRARYPATAQYKLNTYPLFVERGLELIRDGGVLGYIIPDSWLSGRYYSGLRRLLLNQTILEVTVIREDFWRHGRVGQSVILFVRKGAAPANHKVDIKVCATVAELEQREPFSVPQRDLTWGELDRFLITANPEERELVRHMDTISGGSVLGDYLKSYSGLIGRRGQASLLRSQLPEHAGPWGRLLRSGREIDRYRVSWAGEHVCLDPAMIKSGGFLPYYQKPKLLLRQTADALRAVYDASGYFCLNNIHLLIPRTEGTSLRAFLAIINSEAVNRYYRALSNEMGRLYAQVDLDLLAALPIPPISEEMALGLESLVREREDAAPKEAASVEEQINGLVKGMYCA